MPKLDSGGGFGLAAVLPMTIHQFFLALTILAPIVLCARSRRLQSAMFDRGVERTIAIILLATEFGQLLFKAFADHENPASILPMHLCDWALLIVSAALWWQSRRLFDVAYFWGLAGTMQGLLTPAIDPALAAWRHVAFFVVHAGIVIGVLFLVFAKGMRPHWSSWPRLLIWSEGYLLAALSVNALTGQNYGFLSQPPITPSLLDYFPQDRWLYVATINGVALTAFLLLYLPWWIVDLRRAGPKA